MKIKGWKLFVNYGQGWEYEIFESTFKGMLENKRVYEENCSYPQRWKRGYEEYSEQEMKNENG
jgi:hypothetical protein